MPGFISIYVCQKFETEAELENYIGDFLINSSLDQQGVKAHQVWHFVGSRSTVMEDISEYALHSASFANNLDKALQKSNFWSTNNCLLLVYDHQEVATQGKELDLFTFVDVVQYDHVAKTLNEEAEHNTQKGKVSVWLGCLTDYQLNSYIEWEAGDTPGIDTSSKFQKDFKTGSYDLDLTESYTLRALAATEKILSKTGFSEALKNQIVVKAQSMKIENGNALLAVFDYDYTLQKTGLARPKQKDFKFIGVFDHSNYR